MGFQPGQIRHAYGIDQVVFNGGTVVGDGSGQTIAIIDAYDNPNIASDLTRFDQALGVAAPPSFTKVNQSGGTAYPGVDSTGGWETEEALDVEWSHALAPGARIVLVEANSASFSDLNAAVDYARHLAGVTVVSMSYGGGEFSSEANYDSYFTTPSGHAGVTFVASTGDSGAPTQYPAASPNVLAVGGTTLTLNSSSIYVGETGWSGSGGGLSAYAHQPAYQQGVVTQSSTARGNPDVAFDADPSTGVAVYDSYNDGTAAPWIQVGGTSLSAPAWAALMAIADQGRALGGQAVLDGPTGTLPALYKLPGSDFHDITSGNNGNPAGPGYDLVTGRGSPVANLVIAGLVQPASAATHLGITTSAGSVTTGAAFTVTVTALDANNNPVPSYAGAVHFLSSDPGAGLPADYTFMTADGGTHTFSGVTLQTPGSQTITATDKGIGSITGNVTVTVNAAPSASVLVVSGFPTSVTAGAAATFTVTATDANGHTVTGYIGTVHFTSSDPQASLPGDYTFTATDQGKHTFSATLKTAGSQALSATDRVASLVTGAQSGIVVNPAAATHLQLTAPSTATIHVAFSITVTALDAYNNVATGYRGTVRFSSSDRRAKVPGSYTFTAGDAGVHTFLVTLGTTGAQSLSVSDKAKSSIQGTATVNVGTAPAVSSPTQVVFVGGTFGALTLAQAELEALDAYVLAQAPSLSGSSWLGGLCGLLQ
jgi:subtilase family serine protease